MLALGPDEIAKYPFLTTAGQYLKDKGFSLSQFGKDPDLHTGSAHGYRPHTAEPGNPIRRIETRRDTHPEQGQAIGETAQ